MTGNTRKRKVDDSPDTSYLGEYANRPTSEYSIDRAHAEDCASVRLNVRGAGERLDRIGAYVESLQATETNEKEIEALNEAWDELQHIADGFDDCDCGEHGDMERGEYRYFNPSFNYVDKDGRALPENTPEEVRKYVRQDYERMEDLNRGGWCYIGIRADAEIMVPAGQQLGTTQRIQSFGLWGIKSDSGDSAMQEFEQEQLSDLKAQLRALGFSTRAISKAFQNIERRDS